MRSGVAWRGDITIARVHTFVYRLAIRTRLPKEQIDLYIEDAERESPVEDETVAGGHIA